MKFFLILLFEFFIEYVYFFIILVIIIIMNMIFNKHYIPKLSLFNLTNFNKIYHQFSSQTHPTKKYTLIDDYQITGFIGKGSSSRVYQGYNILTKKQVIIKLFKSTIAQQKIIKQIRVNQMLVQCPHVIPMVDVVRDPGCGYYGLIFANLYGVPMNVLAGKIQFVTGLKYMKNILQALQFCHRNGIVHRDLKNSNILITNNGAKLFDFGLSRIQKLDQFVTKRFGTKCYYTPQMIFKTPTFTRKIDIWVCGLIMAQVLSQIKPLMPYKSDQQTARQIVHFSGYNQDIVHNSSLKNMKRINFNKILQNKHHNKKLIEDLARIIQRMMNIQPSQRPQASQILNHDVFVNIQKIK